MVKKKIKYLIIILILVLSILILKSTYSKYTNKSKGSMNATIGQWNIKINDTDITRPDENNPADPIKFEIDENNFIWNWENNANVKEGKVAPGMNGYFNIKIDPTNTDTSFKYTFTLDATILKKIDTNLKITEVSLQDGKTFDEILESEEGIYTCTKLKKLSEIQSDDEKIRCDNIIVKIEWPEDDDEKDTNLAKDAYKTEDIVFPVNINAIQYTGG